MPESRSNLIHGLTLTFRRLPALLWVYVFNLGLALIFSIGLHGKLSEMMDHSLAAQRLVGGFDLGTVLEAFFRLQDGPQGGLASSYAGIPLYLLVYFLLIPGALFCYQTETPARLSTLFHQGILHFWRFVRITLLTLLASALILGPVGFLEKKWADHVDVHRVGRAAFLHLVAGYLVFLLVASLIRLYLDLVEVYTVQLGLQLRDNGKQDRRVRRVLGPAWRTLWRHLFRTWAIFLLLAVLGAIAVVLTARTSMHMLAQPSVWPTFLLAQMGLFLLLLSRFWQRGAETSLVLQYPLLSATVLVVDPVVPVVSEVVVVETPVVIEPADLPPVSELTAEPLPGTVPAEDSGAKAPDESDPEQRRE